MKKLFRILLSSLFVAGTGIALADELIVGDGHRDDHAKVVVVAPVHHIHHRHHYHPKPKAVVVIGGDHHDDHH